ncbi:hypothetical protein [Streptomyces sp. TP-A0874]|uniref:hypothetical protein n=1 Tax=Streptomyces sp. TP-A0874 TaxID=549819 RepID=UPI000852BC57|nr:hypothetical protein [Streptomyces sp. TP-A0874]
MGVSGPPLPDSAGQARGPVMDREAVDQALARLSAEHQAIEASLLTLQEHAGRRMLEGTELTGETRARWAAAEEATARLWTHFEAYTEGLRRARAVRERRRWPDHAELSELTELLSGGCVVPPVGRAPERSTEQPAAGGPEPAPSGEPLGFRELVDRINGWYRQALDVVIAADKVWSALPARMDMLGAELRRIRSLARSVGVRPGEHPAGDELEHITAELTALRARVVSDPLAFWSAAGGGSASSAPGSGRPDTSAYDRAARALEDVRRDVEAVLTVRQDAEQRLYRLRDVLSRADRTLAEARTARGEVLAKIAASEVPAVSGPPTVLHEQLTAAARYRRHSQWHRLSPLLDSLEERAEEELSRARESLTAVTAPLAVRAGLRSRLDACRARATHQGVAGDPLLEELYDTARRLLWSAPCDLRAAERAVSRYQRATAESATTGPAAGPLPGDGPVSGGPPNSSAESGRPC